MPSTVLQDVIPLLLPRHRCLGGRPRPWLCNMPPSLTTQSLPILFSSIIAANIKRIRLNHAHRFKLCACRHP